MIQEKFAAEFQELRDQYFAGTAEAGMVYEGLDKFLARNQDHDHDTQDEFNFFLSAKVACESEAGFPPLEHKCLENLRSDGYKALPLNPVCGHAAS